MPFDVIPAIDVSGGRLARLHGGRIEPIAAFDGDPVAAAEEFTLRGARWLHVVDLDLAFTGEPANLQTISLLAVMDAHVQASGGIASEEHVRAALGAGAERVVLGSAALADRPLVERMLAHFGEALVVAVEVSGGRVRSRGKAGVELPLEETLTWLRSIDAPRLLHVAVDRVGELSGPDVDGIAGVAFRTQRPVVASGGIATVEHVRAVASLGPLVQGAILGRALYEGELTVRDAIRGVADAGA